MQLLEWVASRAIGSRSRELAPPPSARVTQESTDPSPCGDDPALSSGLLGVPPCRVHGAFPPRVAGASLLRTYSSIREVALYGFHATAPADKHFVLQRSQPMPRKWSQRLLGGGQPFPLAVASGDLLHTLVPLSSSAVNVPMSLR